jgi:ribA/ribD-fused uncharacterized protein
MTIFFYRAADPYSELSNHSPHGFEMDGLYWPTIEHYYQAQKFAGSEYVETIRLAKTPMAAKRLGRTGDWPVRPDWETLKESVIFRATLAKFETHSDARAVLLATGDEELVETSPTDAYWGSGADGRGANRYGCILMEVRALLRSCQSPASVCRATQKLDLFSGQLRDRQMQGN